MPNKVPEQKKKAAVETLAATPGKTLTAPLKKPPKAKESGCVVQYCSCVSPFQDKRYGPGRRVFICTPKNGTRCTVCGPR
jgi:hypothetical protein